MRLSFGPRRLVLTRFTARQGATLRVWDELLTRGSYGGVVLLKTSVALFQCAESWLRDMHDAWEVTASLPAALQSFHDRDKLVRLQTAALRGFPMARLIIMHQVRRSGESVRIGLFSTAFDCRRPFSPAFDCRRPFTPGSATQIAREEVAKELARHRCVASPSPLLCRKLNRRAGLPTDLEGRWTPRKTDPRPGRSTNYSGGKSHHHHHRHHRGNDASSPLVRSSLRGAAGTTQQVNK
eukprot:3693082-Pyramimonas_sp.AAC.1